MLISVVFLAFATSEVSFIKLFGIGLTLAVLLDAFVIRGTLVPAFMRLAGEANWWAPRWLRRIYEPLRHQRDGRPRRRSSSELVAEARAPSTTGRDREPLRAAGRSRRR